jgi:hypothetical protein
MSVILDFEIMPKFDVLPLQRHLASFFDICGGSFRPNLIQENKKYWSYLRILFYRIILSTELLGEFLEKTAIFS